MSEKCGHAAPADDSGKEVVVSVIVTTFNHEPYIRKALDRILCQKTSFAFEVVIHDDASTDKTQTILSEYASSYRSIKLVLESKNQFSIGNTFASEVRLLCKGRYLAYCEGDDYWTDERKLQKQVDYLDSHPDCPAVYHNCCFVDGNDTQVDDCYGLYSEKAEMNFSLFDLAVGNQYPGQTASLMMRASLYRNMSDKEYARFAALRCNGDVKNMLIALQQGDVHILSDVMSAYRINIADGRSWSARHVGKNGSASVFISEKDVREYLKREHGVLYRNDYKILHSGIGALLKPLAKRTEENRSVRRKVFAEFDSPIECLFYLTARLIGSLVVLCRYSIFRKGN